MAKKLTILCRLRSQAGLSRRELAERAGITEARLRWYEREVEHVPPLDAAYLLADALGVPLAQLWADRPGVPQ